MPREIITISVGQCGNQLGASFWERLCLEHGILPDGTLSQAATEHPISDRKDIFFYQSDSARYIPRAVLLDLESRVIERVTAGGHGQMFNPENMYVPGDNEGGGGAGNNWAKGYAKGSESMEPIFDMLDREAENSDCLEAFMLMHSVAGGTGSGLGSALLEQIRDHFPKALMQTCSVFPSSGAQGSDVVVQPYNSLLTLKRLALDADSVLVFDNNALTRIASDALGVADWHGGKSQKPAMVSLDQINAVVATSLLAATSTIRFPGYLYNSLTSILAALIPSANYHFLSTAYTPFVTANVEQDNLRFVRKTTVNDIMRRLVQSKYSMVTIPPRPTKSARYIAMLDVIQGDFNSADFGKLLLRLREREKVEFARPYVDFVQLAVSKRSPYVKSSTRLSGLMLANNTGIASLLMRTVAQFNQLFSRGAFLSEYRKQPIFADGLDEFDDCRSVIEEVIKAYRALEADEPESI